MASEEPHRVGAAPCPHCGKLCIIEVMIGLRFIICDCLGGDVVLIGPSALAKMIIPDKKDN